jgi:hypothetical protein
MPRKRTNRRSGYQVALPQSHGIGLHSLAELPHRNRSGFARWWRLQPGLAKVVLGLLLASAGLGLTVTVLLIAGAAFIH